MIGDEDGDGQIWDMNDFGNNERDIGNEENSIFQHHYLEPYIGHYECYYNKYDFYFQLAFVFFTIFVRPWLMGIVLKIGGFFAGKLMPFFYKVFTWWKNRKKKKKK
jgi:hypothetical protein